MLSEDMHLYEVEIAHGLSALGCIKQLFTIANITALMQAEPSQLVHLPLSAHVLESPPSVCLALGMAHGVLVQD